MARTQEEIYQSVEAELANRPELAQLNSSSQHAEYKLWMRVFAFLSWTLEQMWDRAKESIEVVVNRAVPATRPWWQRKVLEFQFSPTTLYFVENGPNGIPQYTEVVEADRIVKYASVVEQTIAPGRRRVIIKAAKQVAGQPAQLDNTTPNLAGQTELGALREYVDDIRPAGRSVEVLSQPADELVIQLIVVIKDTANASAVLPLVIAAIEGYLNDLPFDGTFITTAMVDRIQAIPAVETVAGVVITAYPGATAVKSRYPTLSGYCKVRPSNPLTSTVQIRTYSEHLNQPDV